MIVLDTDVTSLIQGEQGAITPDLDAHFARLSSEHEIVTTVVTYDEQTRGWLSFAAKSRTPQGMVTAYARMLEHLKAFCAMRILPFDEAASHRYVALRRDYPRLGSYDLRIAAVVLVNDAILSTRNRRDFGQIDGLQLDDGPF